MSDEQPAAEAPDAPATLAPASVAPDARRPTPGPGLAIAALVIPVVVMASLLFVASDTVAIGVSVGVSLLTAVLLGVDAQRLGSEDRQGSGRHTPATVLTLGILLLWVVAYPAAFFRRRAFAGPDLRIPAVLVTLLYGVLPLAIWAATAFWGFGPAVAELPADGSPPSPRDPAVVALVEQVVRQEPGGDAVTFVGNFLTADGADRLTRRRGRFTQLTAGTAAERRFVVEWQDRQAGTYQVLVAPAELPSEKTPLVRGLFDAVLLRQQTDSGFRFEAVSDVRPLGHDTEGGVRWGLCEATTDDPDRPVVVVPYVVQWVDADAGEVGLLAGAAARDAAADRFEQSGVVLPD